LVCGGQSRLHQAPYLRTSEVLSHTTHNLLR
jgi:hypothetical protein